MSSSGGHIALVMLESIRLRKCSILKMLVSPKRDLSRARYNFKDGLRLPLAYQPKMTISETTFSARRIEWLALLIGLKTVM
jgi:hypothetical protein